MARYGYARVSTDTQTTDPQILALRNEGAGKHCRGNCFRFRSSS